jgi:hypothetical protein
MDRTLVFGTLYNVLILSLPLRFSCFQNARLLGVSAKILSEEPSDPELFLQIIDCLIVVIDDPIDPLDEVIQPYLEIFLTGIDRDFACIGQLLGGISFCLSKCPDLAGQLIKRRCFSIVEDLLVNGTGDLLLATMCFIVTVLTKCAPSIRAVLLGIVEDFSAKWLSVGQNENSEIVRKWAKHTWDIFNHNWVILTDPFITSGVISHLYWCATQGCFEIRLQSLPSFLACAERLPKAVLQEMVRDGMIGDIAEFSHELAGEQSVKVLDFLRFLLTMGLDASFIQEVHDGIMASPLVAAVSEMIESPEPLVRDAAAQFWNDFLDVSRYLEDL